MRIQSALTAILIALSFNAMGASNTIFSQTLEPNPSTGDELMIDLAGDGATRKITIGSIISGQTAVPAAGLDTLAVIDASDSALRQVTVQSIAEAGLVFTMGSGTTIGALTFSNGSITDSSGAISFGDENLTTTGTLGTGAITATSQEIDGTLTIDQNSNAVGLSIDTEATTANVVDIASPATTTGSILNIADANAITTGRLATFESGAADTSGRDLVLIQNDNAAATGAVPLKLYQNAANEAMFIDMNADGVAIQIDSEATSANGIQFDSPLTTNGKIFTVGNADSLTTGSILYTDSNSADTSLRYLQHFTNSNALATGAVPLRLQQTSSAATLLIDQNGNGVSIVIDSEAASVPVISIAGPTNTSGNIIDVTAANSLNTGSMLSLVSDSASTATRSLVNVHNDNTLATGATALKITQDSAQRALFIDQNGNANALAIDSEATTGGNAILVTAPTQTTSNVVDIASADSLTTGSALRVHSAGADVSSRLLATIQNTNALATGTTALKVQQAAAQNAVAIDMNGDAPSIYIDSEATTANVINVPTPATTTGTVLYLQADSLTTGEVALLYSNSSDTSTRSVVQIINDNAAATGTTALTIRQDSAQRALFIDQNGNGAAISVPVPATTTANVIEVTSANSLTTGTILSLFSQSSDVSARNLVEITNNHTASAGAMPLYISQAADKGFVNFAGTAAANVTDPISSHGTAGAISKWIQIEVNGSKLWLAAYADPSA